MFFTAQRVAALGVTALCGLTGRRPIVRVARFVLDRARRDVPNDPAANGEYALQRWVLATIPVAAPLVVFDVGAHVGTWSRRLLDLAHRTGHRPSLHAFEPAPESHRLLAANLPGSARVNRLAVSDAPGEVTLHVVAPGAGRNSLHRLDHAPARVEPVPATTVDAYAGGAGIEGIDLLKIDAEGHDIPVLRGARGLFAARAVSVAQFEYNHRWVHSRHYLKDAFDLLRPLGYRIGKLTPRGIEWYPGWDPVLETFVEGNYVACVDELAARLPSVRWWKGGAAPCTSG
jgi:FkbM family methyltransferase